MSGGSWDYSFTYINRIAEALENNCTLEYDQNLELSPEQTSARKALAGNLRKLSDVLKTIEWVDSGDSCTPEDIEAIMGYLKPEFL